MKTLAIRPLTPELAEKAKIELNENPKKISDDLDAIKSWLAKQVHIHARIDDQFLIAFLRGCKYSLERAKEKIDMYYTVRSAIPEFFLSRDPTNPKLQEIMTLGLTLPLPKIDDKTGSRIMLIKQGAYDPSKVTIVDVIKISYMISDTLLWEDDASIISGQTVIIDLKGLSLSHIGQCSPSIIKKMTSSIQEAYPIRQKGIHFINPSPIFDTMFKIFYSFMSSKIRKRIFVHDTFESLHKHINRDLLPNEYGGSVGLIQDIADAAKARLVKRRDWFIEDETFRTYEAKRPGKPINAESLFGTVGSFRSLEFD